MNTPKPLSKQPLPATAKKVFDGVIFSVHQWEQEQYDGSTKTFEKLRRADTVLVIPVIGDDILFVKEEQPGKQPFVGFIGGRVEEGEEPTDAAARELLEETGYEADTYELIEAVQPFSKVEWAVYTYIARGCRKVAEQNLDGGEKIELLTYSFDQAVEHIASDNEAGSLQRLAIRAEYDPTKREELRAILYGN